MKQKLRVEVHPFLLPPSETFLGLFFLFSLFLVNVLNVTSFIYLHRSEYFCLRNLLLYSIAEEGKLFNLFYGMEVL